MITRFATVASLVVILLVVSVQSAIAATSCSASQQVSTGCPTSEVTAGLDDEHATLEGTNTSPGTPGTPGSTGNTGNTGGASGGSTGGAGGGGAPTAPAGPGFDRDLFTGTAPITLADIAQFRPNPGVDNMEPNGWMIVGLDTNFYATGGVQVHDGTLLGQPASVRFTPVRWRWTYGDGATATSRTPGSTWASQGVKEFDPTATSHVYRAPGTYYIDLTIDFAAEYRIPGLGWTPIAGTLAVPANRLVATAGDAKTVLVERECTVNPSGPGC